MVFYINNKEYDTEDLNVRLISNSGNEGEVYQVGDRAAKIYGSFCLKDRLGPIAVDILSEIETDRILMPKEKITSETGRFLGYTTEYKEPFDMDTYFRFLKIKDYLEELKKYEQDLEKLEEYNVMIADLSLDNIVISNGIYTVDTGSFELNEYSSNKVKSYNKYELEDLFIERILGYHLKVRDDVYKLSELLYKKEKLSTMVERNIDDENDTIEIYTRKLINKR